MLDQDTIDKLNHLATTTKRVEWGDNPFTGVDCCGMAVAVFAAFGVELPPDLDPRDPREIWSGRWDHVGLDGAEPLDVVVSKSTEYGLHVDVVVTDEYTMTANMKRCGYRRRSTIVPEDVVVVLRYRGGA